MRSMSYNPPPAWAGTPPVERAAHLYQCYEHWRAAEICAEEGITEAERIAGVKVADEHRRQRAGLLAIYGDPAFGGGSR